jgi:DNA-binding NarL/FixJ family response regulator
MATFYHLTATPRTLFIDRMEPAYTVAIVAGHQLFLDGLCAVISTASDLRVVAATTLARSAAATVRAARPDVAVVDLAVQRESGISVVRKLLRDSPDLRVLALSNPGENPAVSDVLEAGACGCACTDQPGQELVEAIREVARKGSYLSPQAGAIPVRIGRRNRPLDLLTAREREIFDLTIVGRCSRAIAEELSISPRTVETHRARILHKLNAHSAVDLVRLAAEWGLLGNAA